MPSKIKYFKSLGLLSSCLILILSMSTYSDALEEVRSNDYPENKDSLKVKINFNENPNALDFFKLDNNSRFVEFHEFEDLKNIWSGHYEIVKDSVYWTNPDINNNQIYDLINFGQYDLSLKFNLLDEKILSGLEVIQDEISYSSVNIEVLNNKQINYWTKAKIKDWFEIIRGKIFKIGDNQLFMVFQTTVYKKNIPIYAFRGDTVLSKLGR